MRGTFPVILVLLLVSLWPGVAPGAVYVMSDFESDADLAQWEPTGVIVYCPEPCEPTPATLSRFAGNATSGSYSCLIEMPPPPTSWPGMNMVSLPITDWSSYDVLRIDFYNPNTFALLLHVEISDSVQGSAWDKRYYTERTVVPGASTVEIELNNLPRNDGTGNVDTANIDRFLFYGSGFSTETSMYCDYVRLETVEDDPWVDAASSIYKFDFGTADSPRWPDFFRVTASDTYPVPGGSWGWSDSAYRNHGDYGGPDKLCRDFVQPIPCCPTGDPLNFRLDLPNGDYTVYLVARSGESHAMPVLDWEIWAEGVQKVNVPMDSAIFFSTDYYYRGLDEDYPLSTSFFEKFVDAQFPAYSFTTGVADGALNLSVYRGWLYMLIVYPTDLEAEMGPRIADLEAARRAQFENDYYVNSPQQLSFTPTSAETARGYAAWPVPTLDPCYPDTLPPDPRPALMLTGEACQGESRAINLAIRPLGDLTNVSIEVSDLNDGSGHLIPSAAVDCQYVRYLPTPNAEFFTPVLYWKPHLLQSDFPIDVPEQVTKQFWVEINVPEGAVGGTYTGTVTVHTSVADLAVPLTLTVWPFQLDAADDMSYGWYYTSPEDRYCLNTLWFPDQAGAADEVLRLDFADMKKHGYNSIQFPSPGCSSIDPDTGHVGTLDMSRLDGYVAAMADTGFGGAWKGQVGTLSVANRILGSSSVNEFDANFDAAFKDVLARMVGWSDNAGVPVVMYLVDEPRETGIQSWNRNLADTLSYCDLADQVPGVVSTVTVMSDSDDGLDYAVIADNTDIVQTHPWDNSAGLIDRGLSQAKPVWFYNTWDEDMWSQYRWGDLRLIYGFYQYKVGDGCWEWHFDWLDGDMWDPSPYSPFNNQWHFTYPSPDGPVPTLKYEWGSQGITDYRYAATLARVSAEARVSGDADLVTLADQADALLQSLLDDTPEYPVHSNEHFGGLTEGPSYLPDLESALDDYRRQMAELIVTLMNTPLSADCEIVEVGLPRSLRWEETAQVAMTVRNNSGETWRAAEGYQLVPAGGADHWGIGSVSLGEDVAPSEEYCFQVTVSAPAFTTLAYPAGAEQSDPGELAALPCDWNLVRGADPVSGGTVTHDIVVSRFPDDQPGSRGEWARFYIEQCAGRVPHIVLGFPDGSYGPQVRVSRDQMAVFMRRSMKIPKVAWADVAEEDRFSDVGEDFWAAGDIYALVAAGVVEGYTGGVYHPYLTVSRAQMAVFVARATDYFGDKASYRDEDNASLVQDDVFPDVPAGLWSDAEIKCCVDNGVVRGYPNGRYEPSFTVSRDQMAVFVWRAFIMPTNVPMILSGPAITATNPQTAASQGSPSLNSAPAADPGYAYVLFDAFRLDASLTGADSFFDVSFALRSAATTTVTHTVSLTASDLTAARAAAIASGVPYYPVSWDIPSGISAGDYTLVVKVEDVDSTMLEVARQVDFTITP
ncbi:MAG: S-layer homology domain-containing protein [Armatimonadota bacterium]|nr:MAG: S-layer homology domain-containing protein [Armatimonadota bacterium]